MGLDDGVHKLVPDAGLPPSVEAGLGAVFLVNALDHVFGYTAVNDMAVRDPAHFHTFRQNTWGTESREFKPRV